MAERPPNKHPVGEEPSSSHMLGWMSKARDIGGTIAKQLVGGGTGPLLFACLCLAVAYKNRRKSGPMHRPVLHRSVSMAALHGGKVALQRIIDSTEVRIDGAATEEAVKQFKELLGQVPLSFNKLQREAAKLEMTGKEKEAVEMLKNAWKKAEKAGQPHEAHELQMLLVEMLIYEAEYLEALECKCLQDKEISDARGPLYKAVIYAIMNNKNRAKEYYKEFQTIRSRFYLSSDSKDGSPLHDMVYSFEKFEKVVSNLKKEIEHAHKIKPH